MLHSEVRLLSSSADTPAICRIARHVGMAVSIAFVREWMLRYSLGTMSRSRELRPSRSSFQTISFSSARIACRQREMAALLACKSASSEHLGRLNGHGEKAGALVDSYRERIFLSLASESDVEIH